MFVGSEKRYYIWIGLLRKNNPSLDVAYLIGDFK